MQLDKDMLLVKIKEFSECYGQQSVIQDKLEELIRDIELDAYNIVVMGEFKRGKSTFINALLGQEILPMDILPETTTINTLSYSEAMEVTIHYTDGSIVKECGDMDILKKFSAQNRHFNPSKIDFVEVGYPSSYLQGGINIVDTPGVSDINQQRCEITYGFVPKANAVIFLLDATAPLKKSEVEFIEDKLLNVGVDNIIFLLNRYDLVDEEEEEEDIVKDTIERIKANFSYNDELGIRTLRVLPISAKMALEGQLKSNVNTYQASGMDQLKKLLADMFSKGSIEKEKTIGFRRRFIHILRDYLTYLREEKSLQLASIDELKAAENELEKLLERKGQYKSLLCEYVDSAIYKIMEMTQKSLEHFQENLIDTVDYEIEQFKQADFKSFVESRLQRIITKRTEQWYVEKNKSIDYLINLLEKETSQSLSQLFQNRVSLKSKRGNEIQAYKDVKSLEGKDFTSEVTLTTGLFTAAGVAAVSLISGGFMLPLVTIAGAPAIQRYLMGNKIKEAKQELIPVIHDHIEKNTMNMMENTSNYIKDLGYKVRNCTEEAFDSMLSIYQERIQGEINAKTVAKEDKEKVMADLDAKIDYVSHVLMQLT